MDDIKKYNYGLCLLRILCCYEVVCCHFLDAEDSAILAFGSTYAVPIFMLLSFVLSADKVNTSSKLLRRLKRLCVPFWAWGLFYWVAYLCLSYIGLATRPTVLQLLLQEIGGAPINPPLWFLNNQILLTIIVFAIVNICKTRWGKNIVAGSVIVLSLILQYTGIANVAISSIDIENGWMAITIGRFIPMSVYAMLGILICNNKILDAVAKYKKILLLVGGCLIGTIIYISNTDEMIYSFGYEGVCAIIVSICVFLLFYFIPMRRIPGRVVKIIIELSRYTLGVYCIHIMIGTTLLNIFERANLKLNSVFLCCIIYMIGQLFSKIVVMISGSKLELLVK